MPVPFPDVDAPLMGPPDRGEVVHLTRGLKTAMQPDDGLSPLQAKVLTAITASMTGHELDLDELEPIGPVEFAEGLAGRDRRFRAEMVHLMDLGHMLLPFPDAGVADRVIAFATELSVPTDSLHKAKALATGSAQLVAADIDRGSYISTLDLSEFTPLRTSEDHVQAWSATAVAPELAARWRALGDLDEGTLGRAVHDFYVARGFHFPGEPDSVPPLLSQHDWVHVLADYGSRLEAEIEVFAFMARASDNPEAFALLGMAITLFHTGLLPAAAGLFEADHGVLDLDGMPERLADAFRRGALVAGSVDFLALDYFSMADRTLDDIRRAYNITPKSDVAVAVGSRGPFEPGGISDSQLDAGRRMAESRGQAYDAFGALG
ncbi:MAG: hypothetical protein RIB98_15035 [Acidimicrobiales bacterium]